MTACHKEVTNLELTGQMKVVEHSKNEVIIQLLELLKCKHDKITDQKWAKVLLVALGDLQKKHINELIFTTCSTSGLEIAHLCSSNYRFCPIQQLHESPVFIYEHLKEAQRLLSESRWSVKTRASIYGLHQSSKLWNSTIDGFLKKFGLYQMISEPCLYLCSSNIPNLDRNNNQLRIDDLDTWKQELSTRATHMKLVLALPVDEMLFAGTSTALNQLKTVIQERAN